MRPGVSKVRSEPSIRCQLENIAGATGGGASTMLTVVPEGTAVKQGDVLATLDASNYEEMLRQQVITVEQAKASHLQAELNLEIALLGGQRVSRRHRRGDAQGDGRLACAWRDRTCRCAADHLSWTSKMNGKGYSSLATIVSEKYSVSQMQFAVSKQLMAMDLYQRFTQPKTEKNLQQAGDDRPDRAWQRRPSTPAPSSTGWTNSRSKSSTARFAHLTMASCIITKTPIRGEESGRDRGRDGGAAAAGAFLSSRPLGAGSPDGLE